MARTIIVSDLHGYPELLDNALEDAAFGEGDRLVVAGDLVDVGPGDCIAAAEGHGAVILAGNHEVSAALGLPIWPQNPETPARGPELARRFLTGEWPLAAAVEGWLVCHGGISVLFRDLIAQAGGDAEMLASALNESFRAEIRDLLDADMTIDDEGRSLLVSNELGPLWFRAGRADLVADGLRQVAGHTPCELFSPAQLAALARKDFLLTDPGAHLERDPRRHVRYVVIEDGEARLVGGCPTA